MADIDPADQWVLDPETGTYQLRLEGAPAPAPGARPEPEPVVDGGGERRRGGHRAPRAVRRRPGRRRALLWGTGALALLLTAGGVTGSLVYRHLNGNISTVDVGDVGAKSVAAAGPMNLLVIGTDRRVGLGRRYGDAGSVGHADTTILFHVAKDRSGATALSIPRDLITDVPDCPTRSRDGRVRVVPGRRGVRFNTSLGQEGRDPGCAMRTVEALTGIRPDHFVMADFTAVKDLSTAVGGVEVCVAKDIDDRGGSGLRLSRGRHVVAGEQALAFVRTRHPVGFGGDLDRIRLQQQFLGSLIRRMKSGGTLGDPARLWRLAEVATRALTVDTGIGTVRKLSDLVRGLGSLDAGKVAFTTVPVVDNPAEGPVHSTVVLDEGPARRLFGLIAADGSLTGAASPAPRVAGPLDGPRAAPGQVSVEVFNGSGVWGGAHSTVGWLREAKGVEGAIVGGNAPARIARTTLVYGPQQAGQAREVAALLGLPAAAMRASGIGRTALILTLGQDFSRAGRPIAAPTTAPVGLRQVRASDRSVCAG